MNELVVNDGEGKFSPTLYNKMRIAIDNCASIDDCQKAQSTAAAMATYYHQIHDEEAVAKLNEVRLRAWRKMAEIVARVDVSGCRSQNEMEALVREKLGAQATTMLSKSRIIQLIKLSGVPERNFEAEVGNCNGSLINIIARAHPEEIEKRNNINEAMQKQQEEVDERKKTEAAVFEGYRRNKSDLIAKMVKKHAIIEAPEVGLTLTPQAREGLVAFSVMMDRKMHDQLRDAAHQRRTTIWAILREASNYWFVVNGYDKV